MQKMTCFAWLCVVLLCAGSFLTTSAIGTPQMLKSRDFLISSNHLSPSDDPHEQGTSETVYSFLDVKAFTIGFSGDGMIWTQIMVEET